MIIKHKEYTNKWVVWSGFSHKQIVGREFDTIQEAEDFLAHEYNQNDTQNNLRITDE